MSLHAGQAKKLLRGQIIIAKVTLERAHNVTVQGEYTLSVEDNGLVAFCPNSISSSKYGCNVSKSSVEYF